MTIQIKKWLGALSALIVLVAAIVGIVYGVTAKNGTEQQTTTFYYVGPSENYEEEILDAENWESNPNPALPCVGETEIPCSMQVQQGTDIGDRLEELETPSAIIGASLVGRAE